MLALMNFIRTPKALLAMLVLLAFAALAGQDYARGKAITTLKSDKAMLVAKLEAVGGLLADQNQAVAALAKEADAQKEQAAKAAKTAQNALRAANSRADALAVVPVPKACPDALEWLRAEVEKSAGERSK